VFDIADPASLRLVQYVPVSTYAFHVDVQDDYLYVACQRGFYIFHIDLPPVECGDVNVSGFVDIDDVVWLIGYIFSSGPAPEPIESGDVDLSGGIDIDDVVYLVYYVFLGGPEPCAGN